MASKVYFTSKVDASTLVILYDYFAKPLKGNVAVKVHSGEKGNKNFLRPSFFKNIVEHVNGTIVECNTAYDGARDDSKKHWALMNEHEWTKYFKVDILDEKGPDLKLDVPYGKRIKENYVGKHLANYDSLLVISHFKGHAMGGFGGALKQLSIGCASSFGKKYIHGAGHPEEDYFATEQTCFVESMGDAATSVHKYFKGNALYINCLINISIDCDCDANAHAPCMNDVGILISDDPVAIDQACLDLIYNSNDEGKFAIIERIESKKGHLIIDTAEMDGAGSSDYELINIG